MAVICIGQRCAVDDVMGSVTEKTQGPSDAFVFLAWKIATLPVFFLVKLVPGHGIILSNYPRPLWHIKCLGQLL